MFNEIRQEFRQIEISRKSLRSFGLLVGGILTVGALWWVWPDLRSTSLTWGWHDIRNPSLVLGTVGLVLIISGMLYPGALRLPYLVWMGIALALGVITTKVVLSLVFLLIVTPTGIVMRLSGRAPLTRSFDSSITSYWIPRKDTDASPERLEKYF